MYPCPGCISTGMPIFIFPSRKDEDGYIRLAKYIGIFSYFTLFFSLYLRTGKKVGNDAYAGNMEASYPVQTEHRNDILGQYYLNFPRKKRKQRIKKGKYLKSNVVVMVMPFRNGGSLIKNFCRLHHGELKTSLG